MDIPLVKVVSVSRFDEYDNIKQSLDDARRQLNATESRVASEQCGGKTIVGVLWSDGSAVFRLADGKAIEVFIGDRGVQWNIICEYEPDAAAAQCPRTLLVQYDDTSTPKAWHRASILERREACAFVRIVRSGRNAFFYAAGCPVLLFCVLELDAKDGRRFLLSWSDLD